MGGSPETLAQPCSSPSPCPALSLQEDQSAPSQSQPEAPINQALECGWGRGGDTAGPESGGRPPQAPTPNLHLSPSARSCCPLD